MNNYTRKKPEAPWYIYNILSGLILIYPVYNLHFISKGLSLMDVAALQGIWMIPALVLEIPSGIIADRFGRKGTVLAGIAAKTLGFLCWLAFPSFAGFALGFILWGIEGALVSGALEALLYDAMKADGRESRYSHVYSRGSVLNKFTIMIALAAGGFLYGISPDLVLALSSIATAAAFAAACFFPEARFPGEEEAPTGFRTILKGAFREFASNRVFLGLASFAALAGAAYGIMDEFDQFFALSAGIGIAFVGLWGALRFLTESLGAILADPLEKLFRGRRGLYGLTAVAGAFVLLASIWRAWYTLPLYFIAFGLFSAVEIRVNARLQEEIPSSSRASLLSAVSFAVTVSALPIVAIAGGLAEGLGIEATFVFLGVLAMLPAFGILFLRAFRWLARSRSTRA